MEKNLMKNYEDNLYYQIKHNRLLVKVCVSRGFFPIHSGWWRKYRTTYIEHVSYEILKYLLFYPYFYNSVVIAIIRSRLTKTYQNKEFLCVVDIFKSQTKTWSFQVHIYFSDRALKNATIVNICPRCL